MDYFSHSEVKARVYMTRRALLMLAPFVAMVWRRRQPFGYVDIQRALVSGWHPARVLLDGIDVSSDCMACDDSEGFVILFVRDDNGRAFIDRHTDRVATERRTGTVRFIPAIT